MSLNKVLLIGRLGQDAEIKYTQNQKPVTTLSVATSDYSKDGGEVTTWHRVVVWGKTAENCARLTKGEMVYVEGQIKNRSYDKDGQKHYITEIHTFHVSFLTPKAERETKNKLDDIPQFDIEPSTPKPAAQQPLPNPDFDISNIPF